MPKHFQIQTSNERTTTLSVTCPFHKGEPTILTLPTKGWCLWVDGTMVQDALPDLSADDRERLISGICPDCFNRMFPE